MDIHVSKLWEMVKEGEPGVLQSTGSQRAGHDGASKQQKRTQIKTHIARNYFLFRKREDFDDILVIKHSHLKIFEFKSNSRRVT